MLIRQLFSFCVGGYFDDSIVIIEVVKLREVDFVIFLFRFLSLRRAVRFSLFYTGIFFEDLIVFVVVRELCEVVFDSALLDTFLFFRRCDVQFVLDYFSPVAFVEIRLIFLWLGNFVKQI